MPPSPDEVFPDGSTPSTPTADQTPASQPLSPKAKKLAHALLTGEARAVGPAPAPSPADQPAPDQEAPQVRGFLAGSVKTPWLCPNGHLLGIIAREKSDGLNVTRLYLLRKAYTPQEIVPEPMLFAKVDAAEVGCSICGATRKWMPGQEFIERLQNRRRHV